MRSKIWLVILSLSFSVAVEICVSLWFVKMAFFSCVFLKVGVVSKAEAIQMADDAELDLVCLFNFFYFQFKLSILFCFASYLFLS